jgi:hypothetical protein
MASLPPESPLSVVQHPRLITAGGLLLLLVGCADSSSETISLPPSTPPVAAASPPEPQPVVGFTTLPSEQQVLTALPSGRSDPFAPLAESALAAAPEGLAASGSSDRSAVLQVTGMIHSADQVQAFIQIGEQSGAVCLGSGGRCPGSGLPALLPANWSVTSIDVPSGRLVLNQAGQRRVFQL